MKINNENGIALILVVSIMAVLASIAAAFSYSMIMDQRAAANYMNGIKADYVAKAGIQHAIGVLKKDGDPSVTTGFYTYEGYDWYEDDWGYDSALFGANDNTLTADSCISNDNNVVSTNAPAAVSNADSRWIYLYDSQGHLIGRYAVLVIDESGKININTVGYSSGSLGNEGWTTGEINIDPVRVIANLSISEVEEIINVRYGTDSCAGVSSYDDNADSVVLNNDGIDNDGIGGADVGEEGVDDSAEFYIARPYTDPTSGLSADTPYLTPAEVISLAGVNNDYSDFDSYITTFSSDKNLTDSGLARLNINAVSSAMELYSTLRDALPTTCSTAELAQMAVNIIDYRDRDNGSTRIDVEDSTGKVWTRYGVEGIRINEVMVRPVFKKDTQSGIGEGGAVESKPADGWIWGSSQWDSTDQNDSGWWQWTGVPEGNYKVYSYGDGLLDIRVNGTVGYSNPDHSSWKDAVQKILPSEGIYCDTVVIDSSGTFTIECINPDNGDKIFKKVELSQSPDCEYVELVNISENAIDISGWNLEFPNGQVGTVPSGTSILTTDRYCILAIDKDDSYNNAGIWHDGAANGISFNGTWSAVTNVHQLTFSNTILDDILSDTALMDSPLRLYDGPIAPTTSPTGPSSPAGHIVDQVLWDSHVIQEYEFYSMERNDPTFLGTDNGENVLNESGIFDSWLIHNPATASLAHRGTPGSINTPMGGAMGGTPGTSVSVKNSPFANIGEIADVSDTAAWKNIGYSTPTPVKEYKVKVIADKITVSARRLDAEFADYDASSTNWSLENMSTAEIKRKYGKDRDAGEFTGELYWFKAEPNKSEDDEDTWTWYTTRDRFEADTYIMYVYGREGGAMRVRVNNDSAIIVPSSDYGARFGRVVISDTTLEVAVSPENSDSDSTYFDYILLTPASKTYGRLNINTASVPVLDGLKNVGAPTAQLIINARPFHNIGEILDISGVTTNNFQPISNLITTKSNVFKIICTGQSILDKDGDGVFDTDDEVLGERKITVIYER